MRLRRTAEEAYLTIAVEALRAILHRTAGDVWTSLAGSPLPYPSLERRLASAIWAIDMDDAQRKQLGQVLRAHQHHGAAYKQRLRANRRWLANAERGGMRTDAWLRPQPATAIIDGGAVTIGVAHDPYEVFLMGSYFHTCLSLGNCNDLSVLANAHDANKQVLFMRDANNHVLARQLVAVSRDLSLLGYHCYVRVDQQDAATRDLYIAAMAVYCGRWARLCGMTLSNKGAPATISGDDYWYDDGTHPWRDAAHQAWVQAEETANPAAPIYAAANSTAPSLA